MKLVEKRVVITGGSLGIGLQLAKKLTAEGSRVLVCARNAEALNEAKKNEPKLEIAQCDVVDEGQVRRLLETAKSTLGGVDMLINNAAVFRRFGMLDGYALERQLQELDINLKGPIQVTNIFLEELLRSTEPVIVNLTSALGFMPMVAAPIYSASKAGINSWTTSLRHQLKDTDIKIVLLSPSVVDTRMNVDNPDVESMKMISPAEFAAISVRGFKRNRNEILAKPINMFKHLSRLAPNVAFRMINK